MKENTKATMKDVEDAAIGFLAYTFTGLKINIKVVNGNYPWVGMVDDELNVYLNYKYIIKENGEINYDQLFNTIVHEMTHILDGHVLIPGSQRQGYVLMAAEHIAESAAADLFGYDLGPKNDVFYLRDAPKYHKITGKKRGYDITLEEVIQYLKQRFPNPPKQNQLPTTVPRPSNIKANGESKCNSEEIQGNNQTNCNGGSSNSGIEGQCDTEEKENQDQGGSGENQEEKKDGKGKGGEGGKDGENQENGFNNKNITLDTVNNKVISFVEASKKGKEKLSEIAKDLGVPEENLSLTEVIKAIERRRNKGVSKSGTGALVNLETNVKPWKVALRSKILKLIQQRKTHKKFLTTQFIVRREEIDDTDTIVVIDTSGSMGDIPFEAVKTIQKIRPKAKIVYFDTKIYENVKKGKIPLGGGTNINLALTYLKSQKKKDLEKILITDMIDNVDNTLLQDFLKKGILITINEEYKGKKNVIYVKPNY